MFFHAKEHDKSLLILRQKLAKYRKKYFYPKGIHPPDKDVYDNFVLSYIHWAEKTKRNYPKSQYGSANQISTCFDFTFSVVFYSGNIILAIICWVVSMLIGAVQIKRKILVSRLHCLFRNDTVHKSIAWNNWGGQNV